MKETNQDEVLVRVEGVSKKFCKSLKKSLWYGVCDMVGELSPFGRGDLAGDGRSEMGDGGVQKAEGGPPSHEATEDSKRRAETGGLRDGEFWAVNDVSFELRRGECLGLIGHNGAGKTTLLKMLNGLIKPDRGRIEMRGKVGALIALGAGFNPILTGRENIYINGSVLGLSKKEIDEKINEIIDFAEIGDFIDTPVQNYSSGMNVRLGFAVATAMNPDVLLLDEVLAVGDANFRSKCFQRIGSVIERCAVIFVSHDAYSVRRICNEVIWMKEGKQMFRGDTEKGMQFYAENGAEGGVLEPILIRGEYISNVTCEAEAQEHAVANCDTATDIAVSVTFESAQNVELGLCAVNIVTPAEVVVGQSLLTEILPRIRKGYNKWHFALKDLHLAKGSYCLVLGIFESGNKKIVINLRNYIRFEVKGSPRFGPSYAPIAYASKKN